MTKANERISLGKEGCVLEICRYDDTQEEYYVISDGSEVFSLEKEEVIALIQALKDLLTTSH